jgi:hypothetical protein
MRQQESSMKEVASYATFFMLVSFRLFFVAEDEGNIVLRNVNGLLDITSQKIGRFLSFVADIEKHFWCVTVGY